MEMPEQMLEDEHSTLDTKGGFNENPGDSGTRSTLQQGSREGVLPSSTAH
jgi:hypothetical protein